VRSPFDDDRREAGESAWIIVVLGGARVGRVLERSKMGKFVRWNVIDGRLSWRFDQDKIAAEKIFDGCYIVRDGSPPFT
jgi:hypothetical protein